MSNDYVVRFPVLDKSRDVAAKKIFSALADCGATLVSHCIELGWFGRSMGYRHVARTESISGLPDALRVASSWRGVSLRFRGVTPGETGPLEVMLWNDRDSAKTSMYLRESASSFHAQIYHEDEWSFFARLLVGVAESISVDWGVIETEDLFISLDEVFFLDRLTAFCEGRWMPEAFLVRQAKLRSFRRKPKSFEETVTEAIGDFYVIHQTEQEY